MQDNLFTILDCYETLRDASRRKVTIVIRQLQEGDESRRREIVRHLGMYHLQAEPIIGALDFCKKCEDLWNFCVGCGLCIGAYRLTLNGELQDLVGIDITCPVATIQDLEKLTEHFKLPKFSKEWEFLRTHYKTTEKLSDHTILIASNVHPEFKDQKIEDHLSEARKKLYESSGIDVIPLWKSSGNDSTLPGFSELSSENFCKMCITKL